MKEYIEVDLENLPYVDVFDVKIPAISLLNGLPVAVNGETLKVYEWARQPEKPTYTKDEVGLGNVENLAPLDMPISNAVQAALDLLLPKAKVGVANGAASLDNNGKVPLSQLDESILGGMIYNGTWNASTNTPDLTDVPKKGNFYIVDTAGSQFGKDWIVGDTIISNGTNWEQIRTVHPVDSVNGKTGVVVITKEDVGLGNVDNTSDREKPISAATQAALDKKTNKDLFDSHVSNRQNPHGVTKAQVGLGNVLDKEQLGKNETAADSHKLGGIPAANYWHNANSNLPTVDWAGRNLTADGNVIAKLDVIAYSEESDVKIAPAAGGVEYLYELMDVEINDPSANQSVIWNPATNKWGNKKVVLSVNGLTGTVTIDKGTVGLGNVDNTSDANKPVSTAQAEAIADAKSVGTTAKSLIDSHISNTSNPHSVTKDQVGLGLVVNKEQLGKTETAVNSNQLGGIDAANFWNNRNSNLKTVDWTARNLYSGDGDADNETAIENRRNGYSTRITNSGRSTFLFNSVISGGAKKGVVKFDETGLFYSPDGSNFYGVYHQNNANLPTIDWATKNLNVNGNATISQNVSVGGNITGSKYGLFSNGSLPYLQLGDSSNKAGAISGHNEQQLTDLFLNSAKVRISGNLGLGVDDPTQKLDVDGSGHFTGNVVAQQDVIAMSSNSDVFIASGGGATFLYELEDVNISSPQDGDILRYNGDTSKWENVSRVVISAGQYTGSNS